MTATHTDAFPGDEEVEEEIGRMESIALLAEIRRLVIQMGNAIVNSHTEERSKKLAREKQGRITTCATVILNRMTDRVALCMRRIRELQDEVNQITDEYDDFRTDAGRIIAILRIQNNWRRIRLLNPPPVNPPPQPIDQIWLLLH
jgi:hypothetical protein